jgi:hypothetical protein
MRKYFQSISFCSGFALGLFVFVVRNCFSYLGNRGSLIGQPYSFGYPFKLYLENGYSYDFYLKNGFTNSSQILWLGLTANILVAVIFSFAIGYIFKVFLMKVFVLIMSEVRARLWNLK